VDRQTGGLAGSMKSPLDRASSGSRVARLRGAGSPTLAGTALAVVAAVIWSGNFVVARVLRHTTSPVELDFWRWLVGFAVLFPFSLRGLRADWPAVRRHWRYLLVCGVIGVSAFNSFVYLAGETTPAINLSLLAVASPIFLILVTAVVERKRLSWRRTLGLVVGTVGVVVLITGGSLKVLSSLSFHEGDLVMLLATVLFAVYSALVRHRPPEVRDLSFLVATMAAGLLVLTPVYVTQAVTTGVKPINAQTVAGVLYAGIGASALAYLAWNRSITLIGTARAGFVYYLVPVFTGVEAVVLLGSSISFAQVVSLVLIVGGIVTGSHGASPGVRAPEHHPGPAPLQPRSRVGDREDADVRRQ
jgi:drug/metabolite transporter (DMT)-like permease